MSGRPRNWQQGNAGQNWPAVNLYGSGTKPEIAYFSNSNTIKSSSTCDVTNSQLQFIGGVDATVPVISFQDDTDTGIYRPHDNHLAISTGGERMLTVSKSDVAPHVRGITVGNDEEDVAGIRRLSSTTANSWEDGNCGNSSQLVFLPNEFTDYDIREGKTVTSWGVTEAFNRPNYFGGAAGEATVGSNGARIIATKLMPKGFRIPAMSARLPMSIIVCQGDTVAWGGTPNPAPNWAGTGLTDSTTTYAMLIVWVQDINNTTSAGGVATPIVGEVATGGGTVFGGTVNIGEDATTTECRWVTPTIPAGLAGKCSIPGPDAIGSTSSQSATGNGTLMVVVEILLPSNGDSITHTDALAGIIIPLERV